MERARPKKPAYTLLSDLVLFRLVGNDGTAGISKSPNRKQLNPGTLPFSETLVHQKLLKGISAWSEPVIATQRLAGLIALNYCLPVTTVIVSFRFDLPVPGRVELSNSSNYFVEIHSEHRSQPDCIQAILAHEIAHIFLHEHRMRLEPQSSNEILTDTTAVYLGCGVLILNGTNDMECYIGYDRVERQQQHFGYLTVDEVGYVLA